MVSGALSRHTDRGANMRSRRALLCVIIWLPTLNAADEDSYQLCPRWAASNGCAIEFVRHECAASCPLESCLSSDDPCAEQPDSVQPGQLISIARAAAANRALEPTIVSEDPPIVVLDRFATETEMANIVEIVESIGFGASGSSCAFKRGVCNSSSFSCVPIKHNTCWNHEAMRTLEQRMLAVLSLPADNCEPLRFFRYRPGQTFALHHDAAGQTLARDSPGGPRVLTIYTFLSEVEAGGHFRFPALNLSIAPRAGRAILWAHLLDADVVTPDERTAHEGSPVAAGLKYGVNLHAHRGNLRARVLAGCAVEGVSHTFPYEARAGASVLHDLVGLEAVGAVNSVLESGVDVDAADDQGMRPLHLAAGRGLVETARLLLAAGAAVDARDGQGITPLHNAAWQGQVQMVRLLVEAGAQVELVDAKGATPLHLAARHGQAEAAEALLKAGSACQPRTNTGQTPLHFAARHGEVAVARLLLAAGADWVTADANRATAVHAAASAGQAATLRVLLEAGADCDVQGGRDITPLHLAGALGKLDALVVLLEAGASMHMQDSSGHTPLLLAAQQRQVAAVKVMLDAGAASGASEQEMHVVRGLLREDTYR